MEFRCWPVQAAISCHPAWCRPVWLGLTASSDVSWCGWRCGHTGFSVQTQTRTTGQRYHAKQPVLYGWMRQRSPATFPLRALTTRSCRTITPNYIPALVRLPPGFQTSPFWRPRRNRGPQGRTPRDFHRQTATKLSLRQLRCVRKSKVVPLSRQVVLKRLAWSSDVVVSGVIAMFFYGAFQRAYEQWKPLDVLPPLGIVTAKWHFTLSNTCDFQAHVANWSTAYFPLDSNICFAFILSVAFDSHSLFVCDTVFVIRRLLFFYKREHFCDGEISDIFRVFCYVIICLCF